MTTIAPEQTGFELERFQFAGPDRLEVEGRWFGVRGRRFVRPVLTVQVRGRRKRLLASLEHKPWTADEGEMWIAAFPWRGSQEDVGGGELEVGALTVELPAPGGAGQPAAPKPPKAKPAAKDAGGKSADVRRAEEPVVRHAAIETRQHLERDLAGTRAEVARLRSRHEEEITELRTAAESARAEAAAAAEREKAAGEEAARLREELAQAAGSATDLERTREAEAAAREDADRERQAASAAHVEAERQRVAASEASAELEAARASAVSAAETAAELERLREGAERAEELRAEAERLREENREASAEIQRLRQANRRATAEAERLRAAAARPSAQVPRRAPAAAEPPPDGGHPEPSADASPPSAKPAPAGGNLEPAAAERPDPASSGVRRVIPRDPQATVAFDALADAHLEPVEPPTAAKPGRPRAREGSGPPPTVRRIPPREPSARPEPLDVIRPMSERSPLQVWGTRAVALALVALLLLALALIVAGVL